MPPRANPPQSQKMLPVTVIGSYPPPAWFRHLLEARQAERIGAEELEEAGRDAMQVVIREQEAAGVDLLTDGELGRILSAPEPIHALNETVGFLWGLLARMEGIFAGGSSGMAVAAALKLAAGCGKDDCIVVILPDTGSNYLSKIYNDDWMKENQYLDSPVRLTTGDVLTQKPAEQPAMIFASSDATIGEAIDLMKRHGISQLPVIADGDVLGSLDETRLLSLLLTNSEAWHHNVIEFMDAPFPIVAEDTPVEDLASILQNRVQALIIERRNGERDIVTKSDLIFSLLKAEKEIAAR